MRNIQLRFACALVLLIIARPAAGQIYFGTDTTVSTDLTRQGGVGAGFDLNTNKFSPCTVTVVGGGIIDFWGIYAGSTGIVDGGRIGTAGAVDESLVFAFGGVRNNGPSPLPAFLLVNSGTFGNLIAGDGQTVGGTVTVNGGQTFANDGPPAEVVYQAFGKGVFNLNGGILNGRIDAASRTRGLVSDSEAPIVNLNGGSLTAVTGASGNVNAYDHSTVNLAGTTIAGGIALFNFAQFSMSAGSVANGLSANQNASASISGGTFNGGIAAADSSTIQTFTDIHGSVFISGGATLHASAGTIFGDVNINNDISTTITLDGANVIGSVNVSGPVKVSGASTVIGGDVTFDVPFDPTSEIFSGFVSPVIKGNITLNGSADLTLLGAGVVNGFVEVNENSTVHVSGTTEIKQPVHLADHSSIFIDGGTLDSSLTVDDDATAEMISGSVQLVNTSGTGGSAIGFLMEGGTIASNLSVTSDGTARITGGTIHSDLLIHNFAHVEVDGPNANISGVIRVFNAGDFTFLQGFASGIDIEGGDALNILNGGTVFRNVEVNAHGKAFANFEFTKGLIGFDMNIRNGAIVFMDGGEVAHNVNVFSSFFNFSGGVIDGQLIAQGNASIEMEGGQVGKPPASASIVNGLIVPADAALTPEIMLLDQSSLKIDGINLAAQILDPDFQGAFTEYSLSGSLSDGTSLNGLLMLVQNPVGTTPGASFSLVDVPEPSGVLVALVGAAVLLVRPTSLRRLP